MNEVELLNIGKRCRFLFDTGNRNQKSVEGKYLGFQIIGGTTFISFEYETRKGEKAKFVTNTHHLYGFEFLDTDEAVTAYGTDNVTATGSAADTTTVVRKRGPGRPRIVDVTNVSITGASDSTGTQPVVAALGNAPVKRGPGRPRNSERAMVANAVETTNSANSTIPVKRGPGRPRTNPLETAVSVSPAKVEEIDEIDEGADVTSAPTVNAEKPVVAAAPTVDAPVTSRSTAPVKETSSVSNDDDDDDEVVTPKTSVPRRPANSLARASRIPDEIDDDL